MVFLQLKNILAAFLLTHPLSHCFHLSCVVKLKEFQQKSSPASVGGEKSGGGGGGAGAKKKRKVRGLDAPSAERNSPDNVSQSQSFHLYSCLSFSPCWSNNSL